MILSKSQINTLKRKYFAEGVKLGKAKALNEGDELSRTFHPYDREKAIDYVEEIKDTLEFLMKKGDGIIDNLQQSSDETRSQNILRAYISKLKKDIEYIEYKADINNFI